MSRFEALPDAAVPSSLHLAEVLSLEVQVPFPRVERINFPIGNRDSENLTTDSTSSTSIVKPSIRNPHTLIIVQSICDSLPAVE